MASPPQNLHGRVVAISGAGRGIGAATARALAAQGMHVAIGELDLASAEAVAAEIGAERAIALPLDVTDRAAFAGFLDEVERRLGPVDVLINNAGIMPLSPAVDESDATADLLLDVNVRGVMHGVKEVLPRLLARRRGHIVNIASVAGTTGFAGGATYCGTKAFVIKFSEAVRAEVKDQGIHISCVMPGVVNTELATGLTEARGVKNAEPTDVADAIVAALQRPRFDVFVPRSTGPITAFMSVLPRPARRQWPGPCEPTPCSPGSIRPNAGPMRRGWRAARPPSRQLARRIRSPIDPAPVAAALTWGSAPPRPAHPARLAPPRVT